MPAQRRAVAEIDLHGRIGTRIAQGVDAGAAVERIATGPTFEGVVAKPAAQDIGAGKVAQDALPSPPTSVLLRPLPVSVAPPAEAICPRSTFAARVYIPSRRS